MTYAEQLAQAARNREIAYLKRRGLDADGRPLNQNGDSQPAPTGQDAADQDDAEDHEDDEEDQVEDRDDQTDVEDDHVDDFGDADDGEDDQDSEDDDSDEDEDDETTRKPAKKAAGKQKGDSPTWDDYNKMKKELAALKGRVPMAQSQLVAEQRRNAELSSRLQQLEEQQQQFATQASSEATARAIREALTEEEVDALGDEGLSAMTKAVAAAMNAQNPAINLRKEIEQIQRERDTMTLTEYRRDLFMSDDRLARLPGMAGDANFEEWLSDNPEVESAINELARTNDRNRLTKLSKRISARLAEYFEEDVDPETPSAKKSQTKEQPQKKKAVPNPSGSKAHLMRRKHQEPLSAEQVEQKAAEARALYRTRRPEDTKKADKLMESIQHLL